MRFELGGSERALECTPHAGRLRAALGRYACDGSTHYGSTYYGSTYHGSKYLGCTHGTVPTIAPPTYHGSTYHCSFAPLPPLLLFAPSSVALMRSHCGAAAWRGGQAAPSVVKRAARAMGVGEDGEP